MPTVDTLRRELETYSQNRDNLLHSSEGKYVLIKDDVIVGIYDSEGDAITEGYKHIGNVPFLVKQILRVEIPVTYFTSFVR